MPLLTVAAGLLLTLWYTIRPMVETGQAATWVPTTAEVVDSRVVGAHTSRSLDYEPRVVFRYEYGGQVYQSDRLAFASLVQPERGGAQAIARQYPVGARITCYVNPESPAQAVVLREREQDLRLQLVGPMLVAVAVVFFFIVKRGRARRRRQ